jgi:nucleotide-binding universal stress UspA family protein
VCTRTATSGNIIRNKGIGTWIAQEKPLTEIYASFAQNVVVHSCHHGLSCSEAKETSSTETLMIPRFHHILVPLDLTTRNDATVDIAFELAVQNKASTSLLHVVQVIEGDTDPPDDETKEFYEILRQRAASELDRLSQRFLDADLPCEVKIRVAEPLKDIIEFATQHRVDLIVMTSHPIDVEHLADTWATLSHKVSVLCRCPILLVK